MDAIADIGRWATSAALFGLRIGPVLAFAPPFTLMRVPATVRVLLGLGLAASLVATSPSLAFVPLGPAALAKAALFELALGIALLLPLQLAFAALQLAGRTLDIQAGFGLAVLIEPTTRAQTPLLGTILAYLGAATFFELDGHIDLVRIVAMSLEAVPLGGWDGGGGLDAIAAAANLLFAIAIAAVALAVLALILVDLAIAALSRTAPQINALLLGLQVKTIAVLLVLPIALATGAALIVHLLRAALAAMLAIV